MAQDDATQRRSPAADRLIDWSAALAAHDRWLRTVLLARLGDPPTVDDVLQDVRTAAITRGHLLRDAEKLAPWLYRVAVASALQYRRRLGRQNKLLARHAERLTRNADDPTTDPLEWLLAEERRSLVKTALERLPRREAEILLLKYTEDWTYRQIGDHLGLSTSAVEGRLHRARRRMRQELASLDPSFSPAVVNTGNEQA
jgi:RNA polymerase sigma factor (sigma-70 family)